MEPVWYIQIRNHDRDIATQNLIYSVKELGYEVYVDQYIPFDDEHDLTFLPTNRPVVFHGAIGCARSVQKRKLDLFPFAWFDFDKLCCHSYYSHWGEFLGVKRYGFYPMGDLRRLRPWLYSTYGVNGRVFIRPDTNDKIFTGECVHENMFDTFMNWSYTEQELSETLCVVGMPTEFSFEYRMIMADGKYVAGSQYMDAKCFCTDRHVSDHAIEFAESVSKVWQPHPVYCLDIGLTPDGYKVIECGSVNCAGYYQCELRPIVKAMSDVAAREWLNRSKTVPA